MLTAQPERNFTSAAAARTGGAQEHVANKAVFHKMPYLQFGCLTTFLMWEKKSEILFKKKNSPNIL